MTADGGFLIADAVNHRVRRVSPAGTITTVAGTMAGLSGDGGPATAAQLATPTEVAVTADGGFLIADRDNDRVRRVSPAGTITTVAGTTAGLSGDCGPATAAQISDPTGVAVTADGGFLIADRQNHRVRFVDADLRGPGIRFSGRDRRIRQDTRDRPDRQDLRDQPGRRARPDRRSTGSRSRSPPTVCAPARANASGCATRPVPPPRSSCAF